MDQVRESLRLRQATSADISAITILIDRSVRALQAQDYSSAQMKGALGTVFGVDSRLIADGTYFVLEANERLVGCGGWGKRRTLFGSDHGPYREDSFLDPLHESAKIRAFFVHPDWARRGLGSKLLAACENAASEAGFRSFELGATLTGERLFAARGYHAIEQIEVPLANGVSIPVIRMRKSAM